MDEMTLSCEHCGSAFAPAQEGQKFCSARHREAAKKRRQRFRDQFGDKAAELLRQRTETGDTSLADAYEQDSVFHADPDYDEADRRVNALLSEGQERAQIDSDRRKLWKTWNQTGRQTHVQPQAQVYDRVARRRAAEAESLDRIRNAPGQVENRFNPATKGEVARRAIESRKRNRHHTDRDDMPRDMQGSVYQSRLASPQDFDTRTASRAYGWPERDYGFKF